MMKHLKELIRAANVGQTPLDKKALQLIKTHDTHLFTFPDGRRTIPQENADEMWEDVKEFNKHKVLGLPSEVAVFYYVNKELGGLKIGVHNILYKEDEHLKCITYVTQPNMPRPCVMQHEGVLDGDTLATMISPADEEYVRVMASDMGAAKNYDRADIDRVPEVMRTASLRSAHYAFMLLVFIGSSSADIKTMGPSDKQVRGREAKGLDPLDTFKQITMKRELVRYHSGEVGTGYHKKKLHFRRGHIRRLAADKKTLVSPCWVGASELGVVSKDYIMEGPEHETL